jgi:release factor glutamine methyltransferase
MSPRLVVESTPATLTVAGAQRTGRRILNGKVDTPGLDADMLLASLLGCDRSQLFARSEDIVPEATGSAFLGAVRRRLNGVPVAYLTGWKDWYGLRLAVTPAVLIPRPETEMLVDMALQRVSSMPVPTVADLGTGSGAIAIALARALPKALVTAVDIRPEALEIACRNVAAYDLKDRIELLQGDLVDPLERSPSLIVANLPYLPVSDRGLVRPEVLTEPSSALFAGDDGTAAYERLLQKVSERNWAPAIMMEIDPRQVDRMKTLAARFYSRASVDITRDLAGHDRYFTIEPEA